MNKLIALLLSFVFSMPCFAATNAAPQQVEINAQVSFGLSLTVSDLLMSYQEANTTTALFHGSNTVV
ncbi:MAG: hypothetical protein ACRD3W_30580, partial [Terriglobales bacterium]